jgi:hypothetical protein
MKVRVQFTVEIDEEVWASEYGIEKSEVRADVNAHVAEASWAWLKDMGFTKED